MNNIAKETVNILVTLDENYIPYLNVMLTSLLYSNPDCQFDVYLLHRAVRESSLYTTRQILAPSGQLIPIQVQAAELKEAPITSRYPQEIYYRIFAARYLPPHLKRILYLDPDLIVNGSVLPLWQLPMKKHWFAAASHTGKLLQKVNEIRLNMEEKFPYINSGVILMNLERLREEQQEEEVFRFIEMQKKKLLLPDQDIISSLYGEYIHVLDTFRYNMTQRLYWQYAPIRKELDLEWVRRNSVIIHYCGRNKPWKETYLGQLDVFYHETVSRMEKMLNQNRRLSRRF